jgi:hypothetical protein
MRDVPGIFAGVARAGLAVVEGCEAGVPEVLGAADALEVKLGNKLELADSTSPALRGYRPPRAVALV